MGRIATWLLIAATGVFLWQHAFDSEIERAPGNLAPDEPVQRLTEDAEAFSRDEFEITPRAAFSAQVRVLSKKRYRFGGLSRISPVDLAVGWGPMSDSAVLDTLRISQSNRFFYWSTGEFVIPRESIQHSAANWHIVPASQAIERKLSRVRIGDVLKMEGSLVDLQNPEFGQIRTSLIREDAGPGACEILWLESLETL